MALNITQFNTANKQRQLFTIGRLFSAHLGSELGMRPFLAQTIVVLYF